MGLNLTRSAAAFAEAQQYIPGGVNSPVRSFRSIGGTPPFIAAGQGSRLTDIDGNSYIDFVGSWGPLIVGHAHPAVVEAVGEALRRGTSYGAPTLAETELARLLCRLVPSLEMVRFVNSGTEATMSALRLARAYTGRDKIVKIAGCYHGHHDSLLVKAGSGATTLGVPDSPGVPAAVAAGTLTVPYNDVSAMEQVFRQQGQDIAAVIMEPVPGNMGLVLPRPGYLAAVRDITRRWGALLIFDEVLSGFRAAMGGAQTAYDVTPDLTCLGKVIGGGLPVGAYGGRKDIMSYVAPAGPVYQAGTLSGNPLAMAAGLATFKVLLETPGAFDTLAARTAALCDGLRHQAAKCDVPVQIHHLGSMFTVFFSSQDVYDYETAKRADTRAYAAFCHAMLEQGVYLPPSQFETAFVSLAHSDEDIAAAVAAGAAAFAAVAGREPAGV